MSLRTPSINNVTIAGNIVKDAEIHRIGDNNTAVTRITIANNQHYKDKDDNWQDTVTFVDVELWGPMAERTEEFGKKGIPVIVEGSLKENRWKDKEDKNHSKLQIRAERIHVLNYPEKSKQDPIKK